MLIDNCVLFSFITLSKKDQFFEIAWPEKTLKRDLCKNRPTVSTSRAIKRIFMRSNNKIARYTYVKAPTCTN